jgi:colanic acid/amylovoran biosynthesis glycosyltransferase
VPSPDISDKSLRIGIVLNQYPVPSETFIHSFVGHLNHHKVVLFAKLNNQEHQIYGLSIKPYMNAMPKIGEIGTFLLTLISILFYLKRCIQLFKKGISLKQLIADANIWTTSALDILHFPFANNGFGREHYAEVLGAKMTLSFRGSDLNVYPLYHNKSYAQLWPFVHKVQCNSVELAAKLKEHKIPEHIQIEIIPPALREDLKDVVPIAINTKRVGTPENLLNIVTLGRLHWVKDYPLALRTMALLMQKGVTLKYHILGEGAEREHLMFLVHELGLTNQVKLHGRAGTDDINQHFKRAHIYLQTSLAEGFSNACMEAQAFGLPCVVPGISGMSACIEDGKTGVIVLKRTEEAFAEAIMGLVKHIQDFDAEYASKRTKSQFSLERQKQDWLSFFEGLI